MANEHEPKGSPGKHGDLLISFLASVDTFANKISALAAAAAPEGNERLIISSTAESFVKQTEKLTAYVRKSAAHLTSGQRRDLDEFMSIQDGEAIANRAAEVTAKVLASGGGPVTLSFFSWLQEHVHLIKKIIMAILNLIFPNLPPWVIKLIEIIDEIIDLLLSLLGGFFGLRVSQVAEELHQRAIHFMEAMTALTAWQEAAISGKRPSDEEA